jgi:hypothetical protein
MARDKTASRDWVERHERIREGWKERDVAYLISALRDPDHHNKAARYLGEISSTEAVEPLLEVLPTWDSSDQITVVQALGKLRDKRAEPMLRELAHTSESSLLRAWSASALADIGSPDAFDAALPLLRDPSPFARGLAVDTLGRLADPRALQPLRETRPRLLSFVEWWWFGLRYRFAIGSVRRRAAGKAAPRWLYARWFRRARNLSWLLFWVAVYVAIALVVGFWWALLPVAAAQAAGFFVVWLSMRGHWAELD